MKCLKKVLFELGYKESGKNITTVFAKEYAPLIHQIIEIEDDKIVSARILSPMVISKQEDIKQLQIAFNRLRRDLKEVENAKILRRNERMS